MAYVQLCFYQIYWTPCYQFPLETSDLAKSEPTMETNICRANEPFHLCLPKNSSKDARMTPFFFLFLEYELVKFCSSVAWTAESEFILIQVGTASEGTVIDRTQTGCRGRGFIGGVVVTFMRKPRCWFIFLQILWNSVCRWDRTWDHPHQSETSVDYIL